MHCVSILVGLIEYKKWHDFGKSYMGDRTGLVTSNCRNRDVTNDHVQSWLRSDESHPIYFDSIVRS